MKTSHRLLLTISIGTLPFLITGCGGSSSNNTGTVTNDHVSLSGTVPGTFIEAFCQDGSYYATTSTQNGTNQHPFSLSIPKDVNCRLVMTTNENDPNTRVITPISFINNGIQGTTIALNGDLNMGYVPLALNPSDINDPNGDHVSDTPLHIDLNDQKSANISTTPVFDTNGNGIVDPYDDNNHNHIPNAYEDDNHDGTPNIQDDKNGNHKPDYIEDSDHNGVPNYADDKNHDHTPDYVEGQGNNNTQGDVSQDGSANNPDGQHSNSATDMNQENQSDHTDNGSSNTSDNQHQNENTDNNQPNDQSSNDHPHT